VSRDSNLASSIRQVHFAAAATWDVIWGCVRGAGIRAAASRSFGEDSDLRRWGLRLAERGGKNAKKRAIVAVARMLAVLLHKLWVNGEAYEPLRSHPTTAVDAVA